MNMWLDQRNWQNYETFNSIPFDFLCRKLAGAKAAWFAMSSTGETKSETKSETTKKRFFEKCDWQGKHQRCSLIEIILTSHLEAGLHIWHVWNFSFDFWILYGILRLTNIRRVEFYVMSKPVACIHRDSKIWKSWCWLYFRQCGSWYPNLATLYLNFFDNLTTWLVFDFRFPLFPRWLLTLQMTRCRHFGEIPKSLYGSLAGVCWFVHPLLLLKSNLFQASWNILTADLTVFPPISHSWSHIAKA